MAAPELTLPFEGDWLVYWGGDTARLNHHHGVEPQNYAFDFTVQDTNGSRHEGDGDVNEDYYAYGRSVLAPAIAQVVELVDDIEENVPGETHRYNRLGNYIMLRHSPNLFSVLAHLKPGSTLIAPGSTVSAGQPIAECGNSGNSTAPHLHYQLQDSKQMIPGLKLAHGLKPYFGALRVANQAGITRIEHNYSPIKGDVVANI